MLKEIGLYTCVDTRQSFRFKGSKGEPTIWFECCNTCIRVLNIIHALSVLKFVVRVSECTKGLIWTNSMQLGLWGADLLQLAFVQSYWMAQGCQLGCIMCLEALKGSFEWLEQSSAQLSELSCCQHLCYFYTFECCWMICGGQRCWFSVWVRIRGISCTKVFN